MLLKHLLLVALVPLVVATSRHHDDDDDKKCDKNNFWWKPKKCCLPKGGPPSPPSPPSDTKCPKDTHYWHGGNKCCVPRHPESDNPPTPKCPKDWEWNSHERKCKPCTSHPTPPGPRPSPKPGQKTQKRSVRNRVTRCPIGLEACPLGGLTGDYECLDTATELESCGGCVSLGKGQDCTTIEGAWNVGCERGTCKVYSCEGGYKLDADENSCIPL